MRTFCSHFLLPQRGLGHLGLKPLLWKAATKYFLYNYKIFLIIYNYERKLININYNWEY